MKSLLIQFSQWIAIAVIAVLSIFITGYVVGESSVHALPEYASNTGEPCATCHVNPGGGGPRTLRGLLWVANGRPDAVPEIGNIQIAPGVDDGLEIYDLACAACHGRFGEGLFGTALVRSGIAESKIKTTILRGRERSGMPAFEGQLSDHQLELLVAYVTGLASGSIEAPPASYLLPPAEFACQEYSAVTKCGGN